MSRLVIISALCTTILLAAATQSSAQEPDDPDASSPAGTIYQIPIDTARRDGAPRRGERSRGGRDDSAGSDEGSGQSPIKSENSFGSSSQVPGLDGGGSGGDGRDGEPRGGSNRDGDQESGGVAGAGGSSGGGSSGGGSAGEAPGGAPGTAGEDVAPASTLSPGDPSARSAFLLVALVVLVGGYIGLVAGRAGRR